MMNETKRREIARKFLKENFKGVYFELWRSYNSLTTIETKNGFNSNVARSFNPTPCPFVSSRIEPFIGVGETYEEALEIAKNECTEEEIKLGLPEFEKYKDYWVVFN